MKIFTTCCFLYLTLVCRVPMLAQRLITDEDGIAVEIFDSSNLDDDRYNRDNKIYTVGKKLTYRYFYLDKEGNKYLMTRGEVYAPVRQDWQLQKFENQDPNSVSKIVLSVNSGLSPFIQQLPDYNQTVITYTFQLNSGSILSTEMTGLIENDANIWFHPPRTDLFKILELNPFPYVKGPIEIGKKWKWHLKFGSHWGDKRWLVWTGSNENLCNYEITEKIKFYSAVGNIECFVVVGIAKSKLGQTKLVAYYNERFGFVKLDYINIDGSKIVMELEKVE